MDNLLLTDTSRINYYGRNHITEGAVTLLNSCAGFEVSFFGTALTAVFTRRGPGTVGGEEINTASLLRLRIYRDGDMSVKNSQVVVLDGDTDGKSLILASFADCAQHTVLVRKMNYDWWGYAELRSLTCDGEFLSAPAQPSKKLLVYGDSLTVGYGVEYRVVGDEGGDCPEKEDGTQTYSSMFCDSIGAQLQEYCCSGVSIGIPCWREKTIMQDNYWQQYAFFDTGSVYDMTQFIPDLIICNLGSNDHGGFINGASNFGNGTFYAPNDFYQPADLEKAYAEFIRTMREQYPTAPIIMIYGMSGCGEAVHNSLAAAVQNCRLPAVYHLNMVTVEHSENAGHPTIAGQDHAFCQLQAFIKENCIKF